MVDRNLLKMNYKYVYIIHKIIEIIYFTEHNIIIQKIDVRF